MSKDREELLSEQINPKNKIIGRVVFSKDYKATEEFSVSLISSIDEKQIEVIRFDCSNMENVNVHRFYNNPPTKHYLNEEKTPETVLTFWDNIRRNWPEYLFRYKENYNINDRVI